MIVAVFFPADHMPDDFDMTRTAFLACKAGLRLFTNGKRYALLSRAVKGWTPCPA